MVKKLSPQELRLLRLSAQALTTESAFSNASDLIRHLGGLQSQELNSAYLAIRARTKHLTLNALKQSREIERSIVLTWTMRGTMHLIHAENFAFLNALFGPIFIHEAKRRYQQLKLDEESLQNAVKIMRDSLSKKGAMSRAELAEVLSPHKIPVAGQAIAHLIRHAALLGIICFGPEVNGDLTYVLVEDWLKLGKSMIPANPEAELARRYLQAYAPATLYDFAVWSGLSIGQAKAAFATISQELIELEDESGALWMLKNQRQMLNTSLRLLPRYDNYLLGYQKRDFMLEAASTKQIHPGGGLIRPSLIVDGKAQGSWRIEQKRGNTLLIIEAIEAIPDVQIATIQAEVADIGRFLQQDISLEIESC